ncbi:hypothetical protein SAMN04487950_1927 [Halogranum rubrum]|uniref:RecA-superfamily ATPase, KaiC/GvpD/RAD55 family n=1 Tax=Halogranum rubrum TaxID=553466 RepID=A0A1I4E7G6_9EURY|nr:hypothetical protein [Halogranum rubrum]SFL01099.1 hypothetical protein SAMN04487950_1927 [Halogranum rubrum]
MEGDVERLESHLQSLKRRGANVLVLTDPSEAATSTVCLQLLGCESMVRRRLLVRTRDNTPLDTDFDPTRFGFVDVTGSATRATLTESADRPDSGDVTDRFGTVDSVEPQTPYTPASTADDMPRWFSRVEPNASLSTLARHVHDHLTRFETTDPKPGEIRVCVDSLDTLVDDAPSHHLRRFLQVVTSRIRAAGAIGHFHLSASPRENSPVTVDGLFDATVETRPTVDGTQQRWTLHGPGIQTDWLQFD